MKLLKLLVLLVLVILLSNVSTKKRAKFNKNNKKRDDSSNKQIFLMKYHRRCLITEFNKLNEKKSNQELKKAAEDLENLNVEETMNKGEKLSQKEKDDNVVSSISKTFKILEPLKKVFDEKVYKTVSEIMNRCYEDATNAMNKIRKK